MLRTIKKFEFYFLYAFLSQSPLDANLLFLIRIIKRGGNMFFKNISSYIGSVLEKSG